MAINQCPGQNRQFWGHRDIFDAACPHCGVSLEFWKDDIRRACPSCGQNVLNPKIDLACARWCKSAEQCLEGLTLEDQLIAVVKDLLDGRPGCFDHTLCLLDHAKRILESTDADARVVIAAALLRETGAAANAIGDGRPAPEARSGADILRHLGVEEETCTRVDDIIAHLDTPAAHEPVEFDIVHDADLLQRWMIDGLPDPTPALERQLNAAFRTAGGRRLAKSFILRAAAPGPAQRS